MMHAHLIFITKYRGKIRQEFPDVKYHWTSRKSGALWSPSYFAGSVGGAPIEILKQYIEQQDRPL